MNNAKSFSVEEFDVYYAQVIKGEVANTRMIALTYAQYVSKKVSKLKYNKDFITIFFTKIYNLNYFSPLE